MTHSRTAAVILNWNATANSLACLLELQERKVDAFLVDNGSKPASLKTILDAFPDTIVIKNKKNLGYATASNQGIQRALEQDYEFILTLNTDVRLEASTILQLEQVLKNHPKAGAVSPLILYPDGKTIWFAGSRPLIAKASNQHLQNIQQDTIYSSATLNAACLLLRSSVLREVGLFDPNYFAYFEDADLTLRIQQAGYQLLVDPQASCRHYVSASLGEGSPKQHYYFYRNRLYFSHKHGTRKEYHQAQLTVFGDLLRLSITMLKPLGKLRFHKTRWHTLQWSIRGTIAYYRKYYGEIPT